MAVKRIPKPPKRPCTSIHILLDDYLVGFVEHFRGTHRLTRSALFNLAVERAFGKALAEYKAKNPPRPVPPEV